MQPGGGSAPHYSGTHNSVEFLAEQEFQLFQRSPAPQTIQIIPLSIQIEFIMEKLLSFDSSLPEECLLSFLHKISYMMNV